LCETWFLEKDIASWDCCITGYSSSFQEQSTESKAKNNYLMQTSIANVTFRHVIPHSLVNNYQLFGGTWYLECQGGKWKQHLLFAELYCASSILHLDLKIPNALFVKIKVYETAQSV
jgi:hypothetical protein